MLIIGAYGSGKSSLCEELAGVLESAEMPYGAIDLDWLGWYDAPGRRLDHDRRDPVATANLEEVVGNYVSAGVERVVQLTVPYEEIERRLSASVSTARAQDLEEAKRQSERGDLGLSDVVIVNDRPIWEIADEVLDWLGWT